MVSGLVRALASPKLAGRPLTQRVLAQLATGDPDIPNYATVRRTAERNGGSFAQYRDEAAERARRQRR